MSKLTPRQITRIAMQKFIATLPDDEIIELGDVFENYKFDFNYKIGDMFNYKGNLYRVIKEHTSQKDWLPDIVQSLYNRVQIEKPGQILPWIAGEAVVTGDKRSYNDVVYECISGHTTQTAWQPPNVPALWKIKD